jgi:cytochrome P450
LNAKLHIWNRLKAEVADGTCPPCFGRTLAESDFRSQGLEEADAAWIVGGLVEAGSETTSTALLNAILHLAAYPAAQAAAAAEIAAAIPASRAPCFADLTSLPHVRAIVKEVLRLRPVPVFGIKHFTDAEVTYKEHVIPAGTVVLANPTTLHFDASRWDSPFEFRPERYLGYDRSAADYAAAADPRARDHFSFGAGRRICPGARLAENTLELAIASLLWAFEVRPPLEGSEKLREGRMDTGPDAFEQSAFGGPKPFAVRFVPRSSDVVDVVRGDWARKRDEGYLLRGFHVKNEKA